MRHTLLTVAALVLCTSTGCTMCDDAASGGDEAGLDAAQQGVQAPEEAGSAPAARRAVKVNPGSAPVIKDLKGAVTRRSSIPIKLPGSAAAGSAAPLASAPPPASAAPPTSAAAAPAATFPLEGALTPAGVKSTTGYKGGLRPGPLPGIEPSAEYNALRLRPASPGRFGVGVQVWRLTNPGQQTRRFNDLMRQYANTERSRELGDSAFQAAWSGVRYYVWLNREVGYLAALSCDETICHDAGSTLSLARDISDKLPATLTPPGP